MRVLLRSICLCAVAGVSLVQLGLVALPDYTLARRLMARSLAKEEPGLLLLVRTGKRYKPLILCGKMPAKEHTRTDDTIISFAPWNAQVGRTESCRKALYPVRAREFVLAFDEVILGKRV